MARVSLSWVDKLVCQARVPSTKLDEAQLDEITRISGARGYVCSEVCRRPGGGVV